MFNHIKAILFDFDGVVIDSETIHAQAKRNTLMHYHIPFSENVFDQFKGRTDRDFFTSIYERSDKKISIDELSAYKKKQYEELFPHVTLTEGCKEFIQFCKDRGYRLGLVTSATRTDLEMGMNKFGLKDCFEIILTGEDGTKHKPDPEPYIKAARKLGVDPYDAIVVEDSPNGVQSASKAGCFSIGITTSFSPEQLLKEGANQIVGSFKELRALVEKNGSMTEKN